MSIALLKHKCMYTLLCGVNAKVCTVASLLAWQHWRVMGAIGLQSAIAVCQDTEIMSNKQRHLCGRALEHTCTRPHTHRD